MIAFQKERYFFFFCRGFDQKSLNPRPLIDVLKRIKYTCLTLVQKPPPQKLIRYYSSDY